MSAGGPIETRHAPALGTLVAGRYHLERFLGAGGMGAVYQAVDAGGARVAVKLLLDQVHGEADAVDRFHREAAVTQSLDCDHIVKTIDAGVEPDSRLPYMVMPLLVGLDLEQLIERVGPIHPTLAVRIVRQALVALAVAHHSGVIHRDIKPANIYLDHAPDGHITVRVLDFGIAKWSEDTGLTQTGDMMGTPDFMAPEQWTDAKRVDARSDVWSMGMTLFTALSGDFPYPDTIYSMAEMARHVLMGDLPVLQDAAPWIDPGLARVVHGTLVRELDGRCPSSLDLHRALAGFNAGSDQITTYMLQPLEPRIRRFRAERTVIPTRWHVAEPESQPPPISESDSDPLLGKRLVGRYQLLRALGEGGMGAVYEAAMPDGQRVAVKVIRPELAGSSRSARRRFVREAQAVQSITNPHVVNVFHVDSDPELELPFIAMELLNGQDLDAVLERKGALDITACARLFVQACRGLSAAHAMGFVHRDVKPANLFLHELPNGEVVVKLCDFGVVKTGDSETDATKLTRTGGMLGSPMFMSPEQATNARAVDLRSDIWSLGASLYEAVGGQPPWPGCETVAQIIVAVSTRDVAPLQQHAPWVPPELCEVIHRTLRRDPADRYQSIDELAHALLPWSHGRVEIMRHELRADSRATAASRNVVFDNTVASVRTAGSVDQGSAATIATATPAARPRARRWPLAIGAALVIAIGGAAFAGLTLMRNDAESSRAPAAGEPREDDESKPAPAEPVTSADPKLAPPDVESSAPAPSASSTATKASPPRTSGSARPNAAPRPPASPKLPPPQPEKRPGAVDEWN